MMSIIFLLILLKTLNSFKWSTREKASWNDVLESRKIIESDCQIFNKSEQKTMLVIILIEFTAIRSDNLKSYQESFKNFHFQC